MGQSWDWESGKYDLTVAPQEADTMIFKEFNKQTSVNGQHDKLEFPKYGKKASRW